MKVLNQHRRIISYPLSEVGPILSTLATDNDLLIANDKWPRMKLDKGLQVGSKGGHGPIKYFVTDYQAQKSITFQFDMKGFKGFHKFQLAVSDKDKTELLHIIDMSTTGIATVEWALIIRWLHDAYIEDAFDKVENYFLESQKVSQWSLWVRILRKVLTPKKKK